MMVYLCLSAGAANTFTAVSGSDWNTAANWSEGVPAAGEEAMRLASSFGAGMGRLREVCGALSSAFMVLGIKRGYACLDCKDVKDAHYARIQQFAAAFKEAHGSLICRDLLGLGEGPDSPISEPRTEAYYAERPCETFIAFAADRLERELALERR